MPFIAFTKRERRGVAAALVTATLATLAALAAGCSSSPGRARFSPEEFGSTTTHARNYETSTGNTCEAARRALLSQGFVIAVADAEHIKGRKSFQPELETHVEIEFNVVCAPDGRGGAKSIAFVNALQDRYALKKSSNSASVGVGPIGSLSLPFSSSDDSLVKVASETITAAPFYDRFFALLTRYLAADADLVEARQPAAPIIVPQAPSQSQSQRAEPAAPLTPVVPAAPLTPVVPAASLAPAAPASSAMPAAPASSVPSAAPASSVPSAAPASSVPSAAPASSSVTPAPASSASHAPVTPAMPAAPASSAMPAAPASSAMPAAPASSAMPAAPASSAMPAAPAYSAMPAAPAYSAMPAAPAYSAMPAAPAYSAMPAAPASAPTPAAPASSVMPAAPAAPASSAN